MGMHGFGLTDDRLRTLYRTVPGPVAFIDESMRTPNDLGERPFYLMSGVIVDREQGSIVRDVLMDIPGSRYWHTYEAYKSPAGQRLIAEMIKYIGQAVEFNIVTVQATIDRSDRTLERARKECLTALASELTRGTGPNAVRLLVMESRNREHYPKGDAHDKDTVRALRAAGSLPREVTTHHTSSGKEPLLWTADLVSWALRRRLAVDDRAWFAPVEDVTTVLRVDGADMAVKRSNPHRRQPSPGVQPAVSHESDRSRERGPVVASRPNIHFGRTEGEYLAALRRAPAPEHGRTEREVALAVGTGDPARFVAATREYLQRPDQGSPAAEAVIAQAADHMLGADNAKKVRDALERLRASRDPEDDPTGYDGPAAPGRTRGMGR
ncbi:DUF3800 domain-containing protein [Sinomonas sp. JGH33]|uniref:DUF3800 domain-containing protein n=1 Tax=Sinomonas terricola TaxID=3110330 RepID=A0ABU5TB98_9MICC|nr:DUF3800 domain-containing protein [Sinomonas sp. JGH33]MEA5456967.1 DUF3800 domain-containing protein [Sinomonas sp. JGH33]